jgi:hypothetical protein
MSTRGASKAQWSYPMRSPAFEKRASATSLLVVEDECTVGGPESQRRMGERFILFLVADNGMILPSMTRGSPDW